MKKRFSKLSSPHPKWSALAGSTGTHPAGVRSVHQNAMFLVDAIGRFRTRI